MIRNSLLKLRLIAKNGEATTDDLFCSRAIHQSLVTNDKICTSVISDYFTVLLTGIKNFCQCFLASYTLWWWERSRSHKKIFVSKKLITLRELSHLQIWKIKVMKMFVVGIRKILQQNGKEITAPQNWKWLNFSHLCHLRWLIFLYFFEERRKNKVTSPWCILHTMCSLVCARQLCMLFSTCCL